MKIISYFERLILRKRKIPRHIKSLLLANSHIPKRVFKGFSINFLWNSYFSINL